MNIAVITGASSGLGSEFARRARDFFADIDEIWLISRRAERLEALAAEIGNARALPFDITNSNDMGAYAAALAGNEVRLLINNAGRGSLCEFDKSDMAEQLGMIDLNARALTEMTRLTLNHMNSGARIINISSIASFVPTARMSVYAATKYYVYAFSRALGEELKARGICVTAVCPGPMSTEFIPVAGIAEGTSRTFDALPRKSVRFVAEGALKSAVKRRGVYTPGGFYKLYRVIGRLLPDTIMMRIART